MKWCRKVFIGICSFLLLVIIFNIGINFWINFQLPKIINKENDSAYFITYKNVEISLVHSNINAEEIVIVPKAAFKDSTNKSGIYGKISSLQINGFKVWNLLFNDKLQANSITVHRPQVTLYQKNNKDNIRNLVAEPFGKIVTVSDVFLNQGEFKIITIKNNKMVLSVYNVNFKINGIVINDKILKKKIPIEFANYTVKCDSINYQPNEFYHIKTEKIRATKTDLNIASLKIIPEYSRHEFVSRIPKEQNLYTISCKSINVNKMNWGFHGEDFFFYCNAIVLDKVAADNYRSREPPDDLSKQHLYNKLLRDMNFDLKIDTFKVRNSIVEYEEKKSIDIGTAKLVLNPFNLTATSICSGFKMASLPNLKINIQCGFMNSAPLIVNWKLNVMDKSDLFNINGKLTNFDAEKIIPFSKPFLNVTTKGTIDEVLFNFTGNDKGISGNFKVKYDDLKLVIYKKDDRKKKNKVLTFLAKIFVKKNTKDKLKEANISVARNQERSFYDLLWRSILEGLKKILI